MSDAVHANFESYEGTVTTPTTVSFDRKSRKIVILNDSASNDLTYKFKTSQTVGTLKPTESLSVYVRANQVILDSTSAAYRVWVFG